jgi:hypothetical protein
MKIWLSAILSVGCMAQIPLDQLDPMRREEVQSILRRADFVFETHTPPKQVRLATMEKLFDHPRLGAAMWRRCQFVPSFYAFVQREDAWTLDDGKGLRGTLNLIHRAPGLRVYLVEGRAEAGRLKTPFAVGAKMVTAYRYWEGPKGFESHLQTWTVLDSALLGFMAKPFRGYIRARQEEFIAYINGNVATFGEFAELDPEEFRQPLKQEGDTLAVRDFESLFLRR